jgi:16S rRNA (cytosine1402-N4)-methyltransferase
MTDPAPDKPPRRIRYQGKNPRHFHEKYKELAPDRYADEVAKVIAGGKTPAGTHRPIMVDEILTYLAPQPGQIAVDCTLGYGGHSKELLTRVQPGGKLIAVDADPIELPKTEARLRALGFPPESLAVKRMNFAGVLQFVLSQAPEGADVLLADLGLSSMQIDNPVRGFTFKGSGPLDMRMNPEHGQPVSALLTKLEEAELALILADNSDEPHAIELASEILKAQSRRPLTTTGALADVVRGVISTKRGLPEDAINDTIRRVFQALRIAVNDEFGALDNLLRNLPWCVKPGGRIAILSFHSGEDRRVKQSFKNGHRDGIYTEISEEVTRATFEEQRSNPRASSAKLRCAIRA